MRGENHYPGSLLYFYYYCEYMKYEGNFPHEKYEKYYLLV